MGVFSEEEGKGRASLGSFALGVLSDSATSGAGLARERVRGEGCALREEGGRKEGERRRDMERLDGEAKSSVGATSATSPPSTSAAAGPARGEDRVRSVHRGRLPLAGSDVGFAFCNGKVDPKIASISRSLRSVEKRMSKAQAEQRHILSGIPPA